MDFTLESLNNAINEIEATAQNFFDARQAIASGGNSQPVPSATVGAASDGVPVQTVLLGVMALLGVVVVVKLARG